MAFKVIRNDITKMKADAIVNTANPNPIYGGGTDSAIYKAAGAEELLAERRKIGPIARGDVAVTPAFHLNAKYIIHTVGPAWKDGNHGEFDILRSCYRKSLEQAWVLKCKSIAFPLIATGVYGFPKAEALDIALSEIQKFTMKHSSMDVYLVVFNSKAVELSKNTFGAIEEYIDSHYVESTEEQEYSDENEAFEGLNDPYERRYLRRREMEAVSTGGLPEKRNRIKPQVFENSGSEPSLPCCKPVFIGAEASMSWDDFLNIEVEEDLTFQEKLFEYIDASGLKSTQIYKGVDISKQMYSTIQKDKHYHPQKNTAILFCLVLRLNLNQTEDLLSRAGYVLSKYNLSDMIVSACIQNQMYELGSIDTIMLKRNLPTLQKYGMTKEERKAAAKAWQ